MSDEHWAIFIIVCVMAIMIMARLDRLGKQVEAVYEMIRFDLARTQDERDNISREWQENRQQAAKETRQFWNVFGASSASRFSAGTSSRTIVISVDRRGIDASTYLSPWLAELKDEHPNDPEPLRRRGRHRLS